MRLRYSEWTGGSEPFPAGVSAEDVIDALADDLLAGDDVSSALARLARTGMTGRMGLDELRRRVAEARARELERMGLDGPAQQLADALAPILDQERAAVDAAPDDPIAQARGDELDALPADPFAQLSALRDGEWLDGGAREAFERLLETFRRDVAQATFGELASGLASLRPEDIEATRRMLDELADLAERHERGEDVSDDYADFADRHAEQLSQLSPDGQPPGVMWRIAFTATPRPISSLRATSMSVTTRCVPRYEPGAASVRPLPMVSEQADPGKRDEPYEREPSSNRCHRTLPPSSTHPMSADARRSFRETGTSKAASIHW